MQEAAMLGLSTAANLTLGRRQGACSLQKVLDLSTLEEPVGRTRRWSKRNLRSQAPPVLHQNKWVASLSVC